MPELTGRKLGKYELKERLGRGGMAEVYKAFQPGVERDVAIKVMHGHLADAEDFVQRFQREARSVGQLQHPHIVRVIDFDVEADLYYIVMDYIQGGTLEDYLKEQGQLDPASALRIGTQVADALAYAHGRNTIHRDIKPGNIMFLDEAHTHTLLADFGIARLLGELGDGLTVTGAMVGTPNYMSPEAAQGEVCDARADVYSLGVVVYQMVTGKTPYDAKTPYSFLMKQANEPLPKPRELNPKVPEAVEEVLLKALALDPNDRYQDAADFADALQQTQSTLAGGTMATSSGATLGRAQKKTAAQQDDAPARTWLKLALAGGGVLAIALLTVFLLMRLGGTDTPASAPAIAETATLEAPTTAPEPNTPEPAVSDPTAPPTSAVESNTETSTENASAATESDEAAPTADPTTPPDTATAAASDAERSNAETLNAETSSLSTSDETTAADDSAETTTAPTEPVALPARRIGTLTFANNESARAGDFTLAMRQMPLPPADGQYHLWLTGADVDPLSLGALTVDGATIAASGSLAESLVAGFDRALITIEQGDNTPETPAAPVFESSLPAQFIDHAQQILVADAETGKGYLPGAAEQAFIAFEHVGFLQAAIADGNLDDARLHAEHVINLLDGENGEFYGDLNRDGLAQTPGDGLGVRLYLAGLQDNAWLALGTDGAPAETQLETAAVIAFSEKSVVLLDEVIETTLKVFASDTFTEAKPFADEAARLLNDLLYGTDFDENGAVDPLAGEGGLVNAFTLATQMVAYTFTQPVVLADGIQSTAVDLYEGRVGFLRFADGAIAGADDSAENADGNTASGEKAALRTNQFTVRLDRVPIPPAEQRYAMWLTGEDSGALLLGMPDVVDSSLTISNVTEASLLNDYNKVLVSLESAETPAAPSDNVIYAGTLAADYSAAVRHMLFADAVMSKGSVAGAREQLQVAVNHSGLLMDSLDEESLADARQHAEHVLNVLVGEDGEYFGDLDGDGLPQNPGDGHGVRAYLAMVDTDMRRALTATAPSVDAYFYASRALDANGQAQDLVEEAVKKVLQFFAADVAVEAQPIAEELRLLLRSAMNGVDLDENGVVDPIVGEGGLLAIYDFTLHMSEIPVYVQE